MKKRTLKIVSLFAALALSGCATLPDGPSVMVLPGTSKTFEEFQADDFVCRQWASQQVGSPQGTANQNAVSGAAVGTLVGAGLGAAIGAATGNPAAGAAIGAGGGLFMGSASGSDAARSSGITVQRRYDNAYVQCMYAKGNQVPGTGIRPYRGRNSVQPPPPSSQFVPPDYAPGY